MVREFLAAKRSDGLSERYLQDCEFRLGRFGKDFQTDVSRIKSPDIDVWLRSMKISSRSRNNFRTLVVTLFKFARSAGYLPRDRMTEAEHVARAKDRGGDIEIFTPAEMSRLLNNAGDEVLPYLALGAFAGIRRLKSCGSPGIAYVGRKRSPRSAQEWPRRLRATSSSVR